MSKMSKSTDSEVLIRTFGTYLLSQLEGHVDTGDLADEWKKEQKALSQTVAERLDAFHEHQLSRSPEYWAENKFYEEIRNFHQEVLYQAGGDRESSLYERYFPKGLKIYRKEVPTEAMEQLVSILEHLEEEENDSLQNYLTPLQDLHRELVDTRKGRKETYRKYRRAYTREIDRRHQWVDAYRMLRKKLSVLFDNDQDMVRAFFWSGSKRNRTSGKVEENDATKVTFSD